VLLFGSVAAHANNSNKRIPLSRQAFEKFLEYHTPLIRKYLPSREKQEEICLIALNALASLNAAQIQRDDTLGSLEVIEDLIQKFRYFRYQLVCHTDIGPTDFVHAEELLRDIPSKEL